MIAAHAPLTATQRAQAAYEEMLQRQRDVALRRLKRRRLYNIWLALMSVLILSGALSLSYHYGLPKFLQSSENTVKPAEPVDSFVTTRVGQIRTPYKRDVCRQIDFDNATGAVSGESYVLCDGVVPGPGGASSPEARNRLESLRDAFKR